jgi:hypothetical protein
MMAVMTLTMSDNGDGGDANVTVKQPEIRH